MPRDAQGHEVTGSADSVESYDRAIADYYALGGDPVGKLKAALATRSRLRARRDGDRGVVPGRRISCSITRR